MKISPLFTASIGLLLLAGRMPAADPQLIYSCDFVDFDAGPLDSQDGWITRPGGGDWVNISPVVEKSSDQPAAFLSQSESGEKLVSRAHKNVEGLDRDLEGAQSLAIEFEFLAEGDRPAALVGLGNPKLNPPASFGFFYGDLILRETTNAVNIHTAYGPDGKSIKPTSGDWFRVRSEWSYQEALGLWTATMAIQNVTTGEKEWTPLYFDKEQNQKSVQIGENAPPGTPYWSMLTVRTGAPNGKLTNIKVYRLSP